MKSNSKQLKMRGYVEKSDLQMFDGKTKQQLLGLLCSNIAIERTCAAMKLSEFLDDDIIYALINSLKAEKKLYTKIAICETLSMGGNTAIDMMIPNLGLIGNNQYKSLPHKSFEKKNYPLPRDIIARTLCRMDTQPLIALNKTLFEGEYVQILEAVDAVGFISYYEKNDSLKPSILKLFDIYEKDTLMTWKLLRALYSFEGQDVVNILNSYIKSNIEQLSWEAERSIKKI